MKIILYSSLSITLAIVTCYSFFQHEPPSNDSTYDVRQAKRQVIILREKRMALELEYEKLTSEEKTFLHI